MPKYKGWDLGDDEYDDDEEDDQNERYPQHTNGEVERITQHINDSFDWHYHNNTRDPYTYG